MFRSLALTAAAVLTFSATAKADPVTFFPGDGSSVPNFLGFDPAPGNILNVGAQQAILNFSLTGQPQTFTSYGQATIPSVLVSGGGAAVGVSGANLTVVFGLTERVVGITGTPGAAGSTATFAITPGCPVNYFQVFQGGAPANNLAGTGFNDGNLVLSGRFTNTLNIPTVTVTTANAGALDQFGTNNYPNSTAGLTGAFTIQGNVDFLNPAYFSAGTSAPTFIVSSQVVDPFNAVDPSAAFLIGTTLTGVAAVPVTAGAGLGTATGGLTTIGPVNAGDPTTNGMSNQVQGDLNVSFVFVETPPGSRVPEPATLAVFGILAGVSGLSYRRRRSPQQV